MEKWIIVEQKNGMCVKHQIFDSKKEAEEYFFKYIEQNEKDYNDVIYKIIDTEEKTFSYIDFWTDELVSINVFKLEL